MTHLIHSGSNRTFRWLALLLGLVPISSLNPWTIAPTLAQPAVFGQAGRDGNSGRAGRSGQDGETAVIRATGLAQTVDVSGRDGEAGEPGIPGENASQCQAPIGVSYNLQGADGGNGGQGGDGGNGGNGGGVTLFFENLAQLQTITLSNNGGRGGRSAVGGQGGRGCIATQSSWQIRYCRWVLEYQRLDAPSGTPWRENSSKILPCDRHRPSYSDRTYRYRWQNRETWNSQTYQAYPGRDGGDGSAGQDGRNGQYGVVKLVKNTAIPTEQVSYSNQVDRILGQPIQLVRNNWLTRQGLKGLLAGGSRVPDSYQWLETVRHTFTVKWEAKQSFAELGQPAIQATISESGSLDFTLPGTLEYRRVQQANSTQITIFKGINPQRLGQFKFRGFDRFQDARNFALLDQANLLDDLQGTRITINLYQNGQKVKDIAYQLIPGQRTPAGITLWNNLYKVDLGKAFDPWLEAGKPVQYDIEVLQTTRSGTGYQSGMKVNFVVDKVTPNPDVETYQKF